MLQYLKDVLIVAVLWLLIAFVPVVVVEVYKAIREKWKKGRWQK